MINKSTQGALPESWSSARDCGHPYYFTGRPCKYGHVAARYTVNGDCVECAREKTRRINSSVSDAMANAIQPSLLFMGERRFAAQNGAKYYFTGRPCARGHVSLRQTTSGACIPCTMKTRQVWAEANREHERERMRRTRDPDKKRISYQKWYHKNKHVCAAIQAARKSAQVKRTPVWADMEKIREFYREARALTESTGVEIHVDHIYPLKGDLVSGLHCPENLQLLPSRENLSKSNKLIDLENK